jgi:probable phosphoglycerate mutase
MKLVIQTDGGSRGNPGNAAYGYVFLDEAGSVVFENGEYIGVTTNNEAEYQGLVAALKTLSTFTKLGEIESLTIKLDSKLVVEQVLGHWKVKEDRLRGYVSEARQLLQNLPFSYILIHIPREQNKLADAIVNKTLDSRGL